MNDLNNAGVRGQLLIAPSDKVAIVWATDYTRQRPEGYTQVVAGVAPTLRPANRQFPQIAADLGYTPPSYNAFDRLTDVDTALRSYQDLGGSAVNVDWKVARGVLTSTTSWRFWNWNPSNDRDFIGLPITTVSAAPSTQRQWSQEIRYAGTVSPRVSFVAGGFTFHQTIVSDPSFKQEQGAAAARVLLPPTANAATPGLLDGYGFNQFVDYGNTSTAVFGQVDLALTDRLRLLPGLRVNYDRKDVDFDQQVYGGLQTTNPALIALQLSVLAPQAYRADVEDTNLSGQITAAYALSKRVNAYATYATGFKSVGLNLNGVPTDALNRPVISAATVKPEDVRNIEVGIKTEPVRGLTANLTGVRHRHRGLPGTGDQRQRRRAARLPRQRRAGAGPRRRARHARRGCIRTCRSTAPSPTPTDATSPSATRPLRSRTPAARSPRTSRGRSFRGYPSGRSRPAVSTPVRARCSDRTATSSPPSTSAPDRPSRRARASRGTSSSTATTCSTRGSASAPPTAGRSSSGRATCSTRTTSSC